MKSLKGKADGMMPILYFSSFVFKQTPTTKTDVKARKRNIMEKAAVRLKKAYPGPSRSLQLLRARILTGYSSWTDHWHRCRKQFVKLIMSYSSAWCSWTLGNIYYGSITPSPMFPSIKLYITLLCNLKLTKLKEKTNLYQALLSHASFLGKDPKRDTCTVSSLVWTQTQQLQQSHAFLQVRKQISLQFLSSTLHWKWNVLVGKEKRLQTKLLWSIFCLWLNSWETQEKAYGYKIHNSKKWTKFT